MPAMPMADSRPPIVVGMRHTSRATSSTIADVVAGEDAERPERDDGQQEDEGQAATAGSRARSRSGVRCRLAPSTSAIIRSRNVSPGLAVMRIDELVADELRAAGDRAADVGARLLEDRRRLAGDRRLVDVADALDDVAVAGDRLALADDDDVALAQLGRADVLERPVGAPAVGDRLRPGPAQRRCLGPAARLGDGLGVGREQDREPQPDGDLDLEAEAGRAARRGADAGDVERRPASVTRTAVISTTKITGLRTSSARVELAERLRDRRPEQRPGRGCRAARRRRRLGLLRRRAGRSAGSGGCRARVSMVDAWSTVIVRRPSRRRAGAARRSARARAPGSRSGRRR